MSAKTSPATQPHRWSVTVGRIAGIQLRVHASFLVLVALFAWAAPEPGVAGVAASVGWLVVIFAAVVLHELAHCFVARRRGAQVDEILLFPLGGVSRLRNLPEAPADEFAIAIVGPLTSIGLGLGAVAATLLTGGALLPVDLLTSDWLMRFAWLNLLLGVFNLLPAFPLDGGRVLRATLERRHDLESATRTATRVGHVLAAALIVGGLLFDVWLVLIGLFVYFGASAEEAATIVHIRLRGCHVRDAMTSDSDRPADAGAPLVDIDAPLDDDLLETLQATPGHTLNVSEHGQVVGRVRAEDVIRLVRDRSQAVPR